MTIHTPTAADLLAQTTRTATLHAELAEEARAYLALLERQAAGEDLSGEVYGSVAHLGVHATLLEEALLELSELADALEDASPSGTAP